MLVDPIDGSQNAERGIPYFCLSVAVAEGDTIDDVFFGYVYDFGANEEWMAVRGGGAFLNGEPITGAPNDYIQFLSLEATRAQLVHDSLAHARAADRPRARDGRAGAHVLPPRRRPHGRGRLPEAVARGRLRGRRSSSSASAASRSSCSTSRRSASAPLDLTARSRVVAAGNAELCRTLAEALPAL